MPLSESFTRRQLCDGWLVTACQDINLPERPRSMLVTLGSEVSQRVEQTENSLARQTVKYLNTSDFHRFSDGLIQHKSY
jgi:hypothetical protein